MIAALGGGETLYNQVLKMTRAVTLVQHKEALRSAANRELRRAMRDLLVYHGYLQCPHTGKIFLSRHIDCSSAEKIIKIIVGNGVKVHTAHDMERVVQVDPQAQLGQLYSS